METVVCPSHPDCTDPGSARIMKTRLVAVLALLPVPFLTAAPRIVASTPSLVPESSIDLVLDLPAVDSDDLGKTVDNTWLEIRPSLAVKLRWKAPDIAEILMQETPVMGTSYTFDIVKGRKFLDGSAVAPEHIATLSSEALRMVSCHPVDERWSDEFTPSSSAWMVVFNDAMDPGSMADHCWFVSATGQREAATIESCTVDRAGYYGSEFPLWSERADTVGKTTRGPDAIAPHVFLVRPAKPLPTGKEWRLIVRKGLPNASRSARLQDDEAVAVGDVEPMRVVNVTQEVEPDEPRRVHIQFNRPLAERIDAPEAWLGVDPDPGPLEIISKGKTLTLSGFATAQQFVIVIRPPFASAAGESLEQEHRAEVGFKRIEPVLGLPSFDRGQLAQGRRVYPIHTVNLESVNVRVKKPVGTDLVRAFEGFRHYTGDASPAAPLPWSMVVGPVIAERSIPLGNPIDTSKRAAISWDELLPQGMRHGVIFIEARGKPHADAGYHQGRIAQSIVQLTDIGLAWKISLGEFVVHAFSCETGRPLQGVKLECYGDEAALTHQTVTDDDGTAVLPRDKDVRHLVAIHGDDCYVTPVDRSMDNIHLWRYPVRRSWRAPAESKRQAFLFTDRSLYRPGETVHLKGLLRRLRGNAVEAHPEGTAEIVVKDPADREISRSAIRISSAGSFDFSHVLGATKTGPHTINVEFPDELELARNRELDWDERERIEADARFGIDVRVEHFRRNAFEITQKIADPAVGAASVAATVSAAYYQGQPVAAGEVGHHCRIIRINPYPERFRDFLFGDHREEDWRYWHHYFGFEAGEFNEEKGAEHRHGETTLATDGSAAIEIPLPESDFPSLREISLTTEVTDANFQTLTAQSTAIVHPAAASVGVSRTDRIVRAGEELELRIVAADPEGNPFNEALSLTAELTREVHSAVKTESEDGAAVTRNDRSEEALSRTELTLDPAASARDGQPLVLRPQSPGLHFLTIRGKDPRGRAFATVIRFHVHGAEGFPWEYEDGIRIRLVGEKKTWKPGETARVLVLSPIEGSAWITIEREKVLRRFRTELRADHPIVEIPLTEDDAPNVYLSALVIKGAADSAREFKEPQLRLGYCELLVDNTRDKLQVAIDNGAESHRPGDDVTLSGRVTLPDGSPAAGAEVALYAVDEGVLAVMGYDTPDPMACFHEPRLLEVNSGISFDWFIPEDPKRMEFANKGYFAGGAAALGQLADLLRKDFNPCATWAPSLVTDADGSFSHRFTLPDTLTRYRVIAVAHHGASRFGTGESSITAKKELMLEPKCPRFAAKNDRFDTRLLVRNTSRHAGTWEITFRAHAGDGPAVCRASGPPTHTLSLAPGASATLVFPVLAESTGESVMTWSAVPTALDLGAITPELTRTYGDAVESRFRVIHPMPELREMKWIALDPSGKPEDLCRTLDPKLIAGAASVEIDLSASPLAAAGGAVDFLLEYPYGCAEQTSSALIPWCFSSELRGIAPAFARMDENKIREAIQSGADRLLALQRPDGSFSYWPGGEPADWAAPHVALALALAKSKGATVPEPAIRSATRHLIERLRGMAESESAATLETMAYSLFVLARTGHVQAAYHDTMATKLPRLTREARGFLAAAIATGNPQQAEFAKSVLNSKIAFSSADDRWMNDSADLAIECIAWSTIDPRSPEALRALDRLLLDRNPDGHWDHTWRNGLAILAVAMHAEREDQATVRRDIHLESSAGATSTIVLDGAYPVVSRRFKASAGMKLVATATGGPVFARVRITSFPEVGPMRQTSSGGLAIDRIHYRVGPDGSLSPLAEARPGDLIRVVLRVTLPDDDSRHLVVEDRLPGIFETIDESFNTQRAANAGPEERDWQVGHREFRDEGAVFFIDRAARKGTYTVSYLARCTLAGTAHAGPAKVESMYDPGQRALSASRSFVTPSP